MITVVYLLSCGAIFWASFCRLVVMSPATHGTVRISYVALGGVAGFAVWATLFGRHAPDLIETVLTFVFAATLVASAPAWRRGVPRFLSW